MKIASLCLIFTLSMICLSLIAPTEAVPVRVLNAITGSTPLNLYFNGDLAFGYLGFSSFTSFLNISSGTYLVDVAQFENGKSLFVNESFVLEDGAQRTLVLQGSITDANYPLTIVSVLDEIPSTEASVARFYQAGIGSPPLDVIFNDETVAQGLLYPSFTPYFTTSASTIRMNVVNSDTGINPVAPVTLSVNEPTSVNNYMVGNSTRGWQILTLAATSGPDTPQFDGNSGVSLVASMFLIALTFLVL